MMTFRRATIGDTLHLSRFVIMADGGCEEALYDGLFPDQSIESVLEPYYSQSGTTDFHENHWIAEQDGQIAGALHAFPFDDYANDPPPDPRVPEERYAILKPFEDLPAPGTYFVNAISVYPEFCRRGIASSLLSLAFEHGKEAAFTEISLLVYGGNTGAVALYEKRGFKVVGREPVVEHPLVRYTGEAYLMIASL
ncbi:MAG: GNAT family N-acetyltransferase [Alphaproteobacteria bacterium]|jgi:ribosomal protein S18 acetylase RimI-like enzyme